MDDVPVFLLRLRDEHRAFDESFRGLRDAARASRSNGAAAEGPRWQGSSLEDQKANSPLCIPGEDHEAGRVLLRALRTLPAPDDPDLFERRLRLLETFGTIQRTHHRREEGCFFSVCRGILTPAAWVEIEAADRAWRPPPENPAVQAVTDALAKAGWPRFAA